MKKLIALVSAAAVLVMPMAVCAAPSPSAGAVVAASTQSAQNSAVETAAAEVSMSVGEYTNNAIVSTPGLSAIFMYMIWLPHICWHYIIWRLEKRVSSLIWGMKREPAYWR